MFDMKELERGMKMAQERETIRVIGEDGEKRECRANIWTICGIDKEGKSKINWSKMCLVGGEDMVAEAIMHMAQLMSVVDSIGKSLMEAVPGLTSKKLKRLIEYTMSKEAERQREEGNA